MMTYEKNLIKVLKCAEKEAFNLSHKYIGTEHILLASLKTETNIKNILTKYGLSYSQVYEEIKKIKIKSNSKVLIYTPLLKRLLIMSNKNNKVTHKDLIKNIIENGEGIAFSIISSLNLDIRSLYKEIINEDKISFGINLNDENNIKKERLIGRKKEIEEIIEALCRKNKNNPILVGKPGVGKTALIEELAFKINKKDVPSCLYDKKIISINISEIVSGTKYRGEFEEKLHNIIKEFESNDNYILFIDEIHTIIGAGGAEGAIDASNILKPYLARNKIKCIGATTEEEYNKTILKDKALNRRFYKILINEPTLDETINILNKSKIHYEKYHKVHLTNNQIKLIVKLSNIYLKDKYEPDKSLDSLDKICTKAKLFNYKNNEEKYKKEIKNLETTKISLLKNKDFKNAIKINNKINTLKEKNIVINVDNKFITNCFVSESNNTVGFRTN